MNASIMIEDIVPLDDYAKRRDEYRTEVMNAKKLRYIAIGENVSLLFENRTTVLYQILEMLRIEKTTDREGIQQELDAYNPLVPGGKDWRATMLIEFADADERRVQLKYLRHVEHHVYADIGGTRITATADEDMERSNEEKTSAVHFLRFDLPAASISALRDGAPLAFGIDHPRYRFEKRIEDPTVLASLIGDLQ